MKQLLFLLAASLPFFACKQETKPAQAANPQIENPSPENKPAALSAKTIVFFGNSLTAAYGLSPEEGFPALIQKKVDEAGLPYKCVNAGLSGETTAGGAKRVDWILQQPIDVFVLELGGNDALRGLPLDQSRANLQTIVEKVRAKYPSCKILVTGMQAPPNLGDAYTKGFREMYPALAKRNNVALMPFLLEGVGGEAKLNQPDGIHPTAEGQKIVAENVWKSLRPLLN